MVFDHLRVHPRHSLTDVVKQVTGTFRAKLLLSDQFFYFVHNFLQISLQNAQIFESIVLAVKFLEQLLKFLFYQLFAEIQAGLCVFYFKGLGVLFNALYFSIEHLVGLHWHAELEVGLQLEQSCAPDRVKFPYHIDLRHGAPQLLL